MFSFPVTVPVRTDESIYPMDVMVAIDDIAVVKPLLDKSEHSGVNSGFSHNLIPLTEIIFEDGRKLPVLETPAQIDVYLNAYRQLDEFFTTPPPIPVEELAERMGGVVVPLFKAITCDTLGASTPD